MTPPYRWPDPDRDYANGAFIPGAADYPPRWTQKAAAFRQALAPRAELDLAYGPSAREKLDLFLPETTRARCGGLRPWRLLAPLFQGALVASCRRATGARLCGGDAQLHPGPRCPDRRDHRRDRPGLLVRRHPRAGADGRDRPFGWRAFVGPDGLRRHRGAGGPRGADLAPRRAWPPDGDRDERDAEDRRRRGRRGKPRAACLARRRDRPCLGRRGRAPSLPVASPRPGRGMGLPLDRRSRAPPFQRDRRAGGPRSLTL